VRLTRPDHQRLAAWEAWLDAAGPWRSYAIGLPLVAPGPSQRRRPPTHDRAAALAAALAATLRTSATLLVLDLPPVLGVQVAARLYQRGLAHPLLMLPRWPLPDSVLPSHHLLATLLAEARRLARAQPPTASGTGRLPHLAVVLDGERDRELPSRSAADPRADNRTRLAPELLPNLAALRQAGIERIVRVQCAR
jgi:hypothetical protein